jgi:hypothetical protein
VFFLDVCREVSTTRRWVEVEQFATSAKILCRQSPKEFLKTLIEQFDSFRDCRIYAIREIFHEFLISESKS